MINKCYPECGHVKPTLSSQLGVGGGGWREKADYVIDGEEKLKTEGEESDGYAPWKINVCSAATLT